MPYVKLQTNEKCKLSQVICKFLENNIGIPAARVYIVFSDVERSMWGWNGGTF